MWAGDIVTVKGLNLKLKMTWQAFGGSLAKIFVFQTSF